MENTQQQNTPETLKPEQMESGKWYVVDDFLIKFEKIEDERIYRYNSIDLETKVDYSKVRDGFICINGDEKIRHATKEEVLKYFPDEVFEPIELRPEDLVSGEVYTFIANNEFKYTLKFNKIVDNEYLKYFKIFMYQSSAYYVNCDFYYSGMKIYHATPEEKSLLLGEEETTDWEAKYNELKAKYDQLEPKGEKVYFFADIEEKIWGKVTDKLVAIEFSRDNYEIYEAVCIGKKKSVLVNETT